MYTQKRRFAFPLAVAVALLPALSRHASAAGRESAETTSDRRIDVAHARPAVRPRHTATQTPRVAPVQHTPNQLREEPHHSRSLVALAAHDEVLPEPVPEIVDEGFLPMESYEAACGAEYGFPGDVGCGVEDCISCIEGATCGVEGVYGPACGADTVCQPTGFAGECIPLNLPILRINWCRFEFFAGVQSFSGPPNYAGEGDDAADRDGSSSFGVHEGFNEARPLSLFGGTVSSQFGLRAVQSNFAGAEFTDQNRNQIFLTGGLFRRVDYGLQGGVVLDYLYDDWHFNTHLLQLRGEASWMDGRCNEVGYGFMAGLSDDSSNTTIDLADGTTADITVALEAVDQHRFFYRRHFREGGYAQAFAGMTGDDDGLLGALLELPLRDSLSMRTGVTYLIPDSATEERDNQEESWNLGVSFVWYPCGRCGWSRYNRPLLDVADNGTFLVDRQ